MIIRIARARNSVFVFKEDGFELTRVSGVEAVEIIESEPAWPMIERTNFAGFPRRRVVIFSNPRGCVAVLPEYFGHCSSTLGNNAGVTVVTGRKLRDYTGTGYMVIATRQQCGARWRA